MHTVDIEKLEGQIASLEALNLEELRQEWRRRFGPPPPLRSGDMMRRCMAEKMQIAAFGRDAETERELERLIRAHSRGAPLKQASPKVVQGAVFIREYEGRTYRVEAVEHGFQWNDRSWRSLSEIAREITGVRWNGPRFFGLRSGITA